MTNKEILKMATNDDIQYFLEKINHEEKNLCHKAPSEIKEAKKKIIYYVNEIKELLIKEA